MNRILFCALIWALGDAFPLAAQVTIAPPALPNAIAGVLYSQTLTATGGLILPYTFTVSTGSLPAGLVLTSGVTPTTATISGTATVSGPFSFTVQAVDSTPIIPLTGTQAYTLQVDAPLTITTASLPGGTVGVAYSQALTSTGGTGTINWSVSAGTFPTGLMLSTGGVISGTPTAAGNFIFTVRAADSGSQQVTKDLSIAVAAGLTITTVSLPGGVIGSGYSQTLASTGGTGTITWSLSAGSLPAGLSLSPTGAITGTPTGPAGTSTFTVRAADSGSQQVTKELSIAIVAPLSITTTSLSGGVVGSVYSQTLASTGGTGAIAWSLSAGTLPGGLVLSAGGAITGTPTGPAATSAFTVRATDSGSQQVTKDLSIAIVAQLSITTMSVPNATVGVAYSQTVAATGGSGTRTWSISSGSLPAGLTIDSTTGTISGTPAGPAGPATFTVQVADSTPTPATRSLTITVGTAVMITTVSPLPGGAQGVAYSQTLAATGGTGPYTFAATTPLPAGLTLSAGGLLSGTPTGSGPFNFSVQATDSASATATKAFDLSITPRPQISALTPASAPAGSSDVALTITGSGFVSGATVQFGATTLTPSAVAAGQINVNVPGALLGLVGPVNVTVTNPFPVTSAAAVFTLEEPAITGLSPGSITAGSSAFTLTVNGSRFVAGSTVNFAGAAVATTFVSATRLTAQVPANLVANPGTVAVTVANTAMAVSAPANFTISPRPTITGLTPNSSSAGAPAFTLTVTGTGFVNGAVVVWNSTNLPTTFVSATQLTAQVPAGLTASPGTATITVVNAGGATTAGAAFTVGAAPSISTINPQSTTAGAPAFLLTITGSGFVTGSAVQVNGQVVATNFVAANQLTATVPANLLTNAGSASVSVVNPGPVNSNAVPLLVNASVTFITQTLTNGVVNMSYTQAINLAGGTPPFTFALGGGTLPPGLSLNASNGAITGTPVAPGIFEFTIQVTDAAGFVASRSFVLNVGRALVISSDANLATGAVGRSYLATLTATGGTPPYPQWTLLTGSLPPGSTLNTTTGLISGNPTTAGNFAFVIQVRDSAGQTASKGFTIVINAGLAITSVGQIETGTIGSDYVLNLGATGGSPPYTWRLESGSLPPGLNLNPATGGISGTPATEGTFAFAVEVRDSAGQTARTPLTITVISTLTITAASQLPSAMERVTYTTRLAAAGGTSPYSGWRVASGALPAGISLNASTGELAGTPTQSGSFDFTVAVNDSVNRTVSKAFALVVNPPGLAITTAAALPAATYGGPYQVIPAADGGIVPYRWALTGGAFPQGLSVADNGVLRGVPQEVGTFRFTLTVTDNAARTAAREFTLMVNPTALSPVQITGPADNLEPATQPRVELVLSEPYPLDLTGVLELAFEPDAVNNADDPAVRFANGTRSINFRIPANTTAAVFDGTPAFQSGTVAGALRLQPRLTTSGVALPAPAPRQMRVLRAAPVLRAVQVTRNASGFEVVVTGHSTSREVTQATFRFTASSGANLQTTEVAIPLTTPAGSWFAGAESRAFGGQFTYRQPFTISGEQGAVASVSVQLSNSVGASQSSSANLP